MSYAGIHYAMRVFYTILLLIYTGFSLMLIGRVAKAYVPSVDGLAKLIVAQHGKGIYEIHQKIFFPENQYTLYETWYIKDGLLKLKSSYQNTFSIYSTKKKQVWKNSQYFVSPIGPYFYQKILLSQTSPHFLKAIKKLGLNKTNFASQLVRYNGKAQYAINKLSNGYKGKPPSKFAPNLIIDNLHFYIQQISFSINNFIQMTNYKKYKKNLWLPQNIKIFFNKKTFNISTLKVNRLSSYQFNQIKYKKTKTPQTNNSLKNPQNLLKFLKYFR